MPRPRSITLAEVGQETEIHRKLAQMCVMRSRSNLPSYYTVNLLPRPALRAEDDLDDGVYAAGANLRYISVS